MTSGFIDIHSHIVFGVDDGAKTKEDSLAMLECARESGTTAMVATPHASTRYPFDADLVAERIALLQSATDMRIYPGCDFHLEYRNINDALEYPDKYTINHGPYLLVEFSDIGTLHGTDAILDRLLDAGMVPVITHPERNAQLQKRIDELAAFVAAGAVVQVTAGSFMGTFGREAKACAETLLDRGLVHVVASDAHDCKARTPNLADAYVRLVQSRGEDEIRPLFVDNPRAIVEGERLDFDEVAAPHRTRKWYQFWM